MLRRQTQLNQGLDRLAGAALANAGTDYSREIASPIVDALETAKSFEGLRRRLNASFLRRMPSPKTEERLHDVLTQSAAIGAATVDPRKREERK